MRVHECVCACMCVCVHVCVSESMCVCECVRACMKAKTCKERRMSIMYVMSHPGSNPSAILWLLSMAIYGIFTLF